MSDSRGATSINVEWDGSTMVIKVNVGATEEQIRAAFDVALSASLMRAGHARALRLLDDPWSGAPAPKVTAT